MNFARRSRTSSFYSSVRLPFSASDCRAGFALLRVCLEPRSAWDLQYPFARRPVCCLFLLLRDLPLVAKSPSRAHRLAALLATPAEVADDFMAKSRALVAAVQTFNLAVSPAVAAVLAPVAALNPTPAPPPQEGVVIVDPNEAGAEAAPERRAGSYVRASLRLIRLVAILGTE